MKLWKRKKTVKSGKWGKTNKTYLKEHFMFCNRLKYPIFEKLLVKVAPSSGCVVVFSPVGERTWEVPAGCQPHGGRAAHEEVHVGSVLVGPPALLQVPLHRLQGPQSGPAGQRRGPQRKGGSNVLLGFYLLPYRWQDGLVGLCWTPGRWLLSIFRDPGANI